MGKSELLAVVAPMLQEAEGGRRGRERGREGERRSGEAHNYGRARTNSKRGHWSKGHSKLIPHTPGGRRDGGERAAQPSQRKHYRTETGEWHFDAARVRTAHGARRCKAERFGLFATQPGKSWRGAPRPSLTQGGRQPTMRRDLLRVGQQKRLALAGAEAEAAILIELLFKARVAERY